MAYNLLENKISLYLGILILSIVFVFISIISYIRPPIGDDVLNYFKNGVSYYTDYTENMLEPQLIKANSIFDSIIVTLKAYKLWTGRILGIFFCTLAGIFGNIFTSLISGLIISAVILCANILIYGSLKTALEKHSTMIILFLSIFYFHRAASYTIMWTMVSQYSLSLLLVLIYLIVFKEIFFSIVITPKKIMIINLLGLLTGITHEIYTVSLCFFLLANGLIIKIIFKENIKKLFFCNIGLIAGSVLCVFSPGNFNRMTLSHDQTIFDPWLVKSKMVLFTHISSLMGIKPYYMFIIITGLFLILVINIFSLKNVNCYFDGGGGDIIRILIDNKKHILFYSLFYFMLFISFLLWSFVSYAPIYGMAFFNIFFLVPLFYALHIFKENPHGSDKTRRLQFITKGITTILSVLIIVFVNQAWILSHFRTRLEWNKKIKYANENEIEEIYVPRFEDKYSNRFNFYNEINNTGNVIYSNYGLHYEYYKTRVVPQ